MSSHPAPLPRATPEAVGLSTTAVLAFVNALETNTGGPHSVMLMRHGQVAAEGWWTPYAPDRPHSLFSLSKSFTSSAVGLAVSDGLLTVEDPVISFFPDRLPDSVSENLRRMRVRHLLTMTTGHHEDATGAIMAAPDGDWVRAFLALPVEHEPGAPFVYNSAATYMCSAIVQARTGQTLTDYLTPRLFEPLGIANPVWTRCPMGVNVGGWGLSVTTEDIARFGQMYLQEGRWNGRQLVPADWARQATSRQVPNGEGDDDWTQGYGFQFWRCRHNAYRGDGAFGQFCVVMPDQDMVLAITGGHGELQAVLNAAWDHLLPGLVPDAQPTPPGDTGDALRHRLAHLAIPAPEGNDTSPAAERVSGRPYRLEPNEQDARTVTFAFTPDGGRLTFQSAEGESSLESGHGHWAEGFAAGRIGELRLGAPPVGKTAARGAWTDDDTYTAFVCYVETPFIETITCRFTGADVAVTRQMNVGFGDAPRSTLAGHAA